MGLLTTLVNVLSTQGGHFSITAKITVIVVAIYCESMFLLIVWYNRLLDSIMTPHDRQVAQHGEPGVSL